MKKTLKTIIPIVAVLLLIACPQKDGDNGTHTFGDLVGYATATYAEDIAVNGNYAYVCGKEHGLYAFDVSDPSHPTKVDSLDTDGRAWDLVIANNHAYIADQQGGLVIASLSDPAHPSKVGEYPNYFTNGVAINGNYVYLGGSAGSKGVLVILDVTNPASPSLVKADTLSGLTLSSIAYQSNRVYAGDGEGNLHVFDVSTPTNPILKSTYYNPGTAGHEPWGLGVTISGNTLYYSDWGAGFITLDISQPDTTRELDVYADADVFYDSYIVGTTAYVGHGWFGFAVFDVSDPANITLVDSLLSPDIPGTIQGPSIHGVWVSGNYAYLADNGEQILSIVYIKR